MKQQNLWIIYKNLHPRRSPLAIRSVMLQEPETNLAKTLQGKLMRLKSSLTTRCLLVITFAIASFWFHGAAAKEMELYSATYEGRISGFNISLDRTLTQRTDGTFQLHSEASNWFASIRETSIFRFNEQALLPLSYEFRRSVFGRRVVETISYNWDEKEAFYERSDRSRNNTTHELNGQLLDPALFQLMLPIDFYAGEETVGYDFINRKRVRHYAFDLKGEEQVKLGDKEFSALLVEREDEDKRTRVWLVPNLDYQIGRIEHQDDDDTYDIRLVKYKSNSDQLLEFYRKARSSQPPGDDVADENQADAETDGSSLSN